jgi:hypothetical protein
MHFTERLGFTRVADGRPEVLQAVREQLMQGASQIKLMAGGGVTSDFDPLDVTQYTDDEMRAAVEAAAGWNTYVTVHAYSPKAIQQAGRAGVVCIDMRKWQTRRPRVYPPRRTSGDDLAEIGPGLKMTPLPFTFHFSRTVAASQTTLIITDTPP